MINYEEIISNLTSERMIKIFDALKIPWEEKNNCFILPTVCHNANVEDASRKLYVYKDTWLFVCYTECGTMSIFNFLKKFYTTRDIQYDWYNDIYRLIVGEDYGTNFEGFVAPTYKSLRERYGQKKNQIILPEFSKNVMDCFSKFYPVEWQHDGISVAVMEKYGIRYSISQNKIIIPHLDADGRLIGIRGRALNKEEEENFGKYAPIKVEQTWYSHPLSLNLYGLFYNKDNIKKNNICYIVESEKAVLQAESFQMDNCCVAVCGSNFNKFALKILIERAAPKEIVVCFDQEEKKGESKYFEKLWNMCHKYLNYCNFSFVYDRGGLLELKDSPTDKGEETFKKLLKERVKVK